MAESIVERAPDGARTAGHEPPPEPEHHHRDVQGGAARAAVFGISDGLVSNLGLIVGVAGANPAPGVVRLAGLAGLIAGAISMAAGEYNSMRVQSELLEREIDLERIELRRNPEHETRELAELYASRGMELGHATELATAMMRDPEIALETHAREELGINPGSLGSPVKAAASSFVAFSIGALAPLVPWFFGSGVAATVASVVVALVAAVIVGYAVATFTDRSRARTVLRQVFFTGGPAIITWFVGRAIGVGVAG